MHRKHSTDRRPFLSRHENHILMEVVFEFDLEELVVMYISGELYGF